MTDSEGSLDTLRDDPTPASLPLPGANEPIIVPPPIPTPVDVAVTEADSEPHEHRPPVFADMRTLDVLDFDAIRQMVARQCMTEAAAMRAREMLPAFDLEEVRSAQRATTEMRAIVRDAAISLPRVGDVSEAIARAQRGASLGALELRDTGVALSAADAIVRRVRGSQALAPSLIARAVPARPLPEILAAIDRAIGERGDVLDRASPALARIRRGIVVANDEARDRVQAILRAPAYARAIQDAIVTVREGRFVIPVKAEFAGLVQGVVHDTSSTGQTLFVEPLVSLEANNRVRTLRLDEEREVRRILLELSERLGAVAAQAATNLAILAEFDLALARVRVGHTMRAIAPEIVTEPHVSIVRGRHPLLGERAVPQSLALGDEVRFIVISGPNMGGKTVALKLLGLFVCMAYCGLHVPATEAVIGGFDHVGCDIGDEQSIAENASTFSAHLRRLRTLVASAGPRSLVLIDEIASGTEPSASSALATATLEFLLARGARGIVTTHATELKLFAHDAVGLQNASVRFNAETYAPTYELDLGSPGQSLAFPLARALGLDPAIVARAESLLSTSDRDYDRALAELSLVRTEAAAERDALMRERAALTAERERAQRRAEALERERRALTERAEEKLARRLREFTAELDRRYAENPGPRRSGKITPGQSTLLDTVLTEVRRDLGIGGERRRPPAPAERSAAPAPRPPGAGDRVFVESLGVEGTFVADAGTSAVIALGSMRSTVPKSQLRLVAGSPAARRERGANDRDRPPEGPGTFATAQLEAATTARTELDVRGRRFVEAEPLVDRWIDDSKLAGLSPLRLIHGKGTGLLGRGLQEFLKSTPGITGVRYGQDNEGGSGVTVFELE